MRGRGRVSSISLLVTALAVLVGVLSMHAVSGGPHSPRGVDHELSVALPQSGAAFELHAVAPTVPALLAVSPQDLAPPDLPSDPLAGLVLVCAAMLLSLVVLLGLRMLWRLPQRAPAPPLALGSTGCLELTRARAPDLLTRLCVLRT